MSELTLQAAQTIVEQALAHGRQKNFQKLAIAVLDARGALKCFLAEDGTSLKRGEIALGKASAALALGAGTRTLNKLAKERPHFFAALPHAIGGSFIPVPGGVLIRDAGGAVIGAVGVSGDTSDNDEAAAIAGITAAGCKPDAGSD